MNSRINEMFEELSHAREEVLPSKFWADLNKTNVQQLDSEGYENFKRTITRYYFNWVATALKSPVRSQFQFLVQHVNLSTLLFISLRTLFTPPQTGLSLRHSLFYTLLSKLVWAYALQVDTAHKLDLLTEPTEGNPFRIYYNKKLISQDLGNSFLEYQSIMDSGIDTSSIKTVMELGAGYGRTGYAFLKLNPNIRYIIVDIPPALYVAERYLSDQFAGRKVFKFRPFARFEDVAQEFEQAQLAFLLPHQLELIPDKSVDLFINISSLHEMLPSQISYYLNQIDRVTSGHFYMKQWKKWYNAVDQIEINDEYPIPEHWSTVFRRECRVQTMFFEALYRI